MLFLGLALFVIAALLVYLALHPREAFYLDEGWKFEAPPEPSETYVTVNVAGRMIGAALAVGIGVWVIVEGFHEHAVADQHHALIASTERCKQEVQPRFTAQVKWEAALVANPDEVRQLARDLSVDVEITRAQRPDYVSGRADRTVPYDVVRVFDPKRTGNSKDLFVLDGSSHMWQVDDRPLTSCR